ncbi:MAG: PorT family protein [Flavobacteriaceae bacterium]|jgi:hypothetical protein|nr:PorT family protein [Flavobacteriaceae bacterium]
MKKLLVVFFTVALGFQSFGQHKTIFGKNPLLNKPDWDKQRVHWGYYLGFNSFNYKFNYDAKYYTRLEALKEKYPDSATEVQIQNAIGFNVGLVGNLRIFEYLDLRFEPGLAYTKRDLLIPQALILGYLSDSGVPVIDPATINSYSTRNDSSTYLHFPLLLKFSALRTGNIRPYVVGGVSADLNLTSNSKSTEENPTIWRTKQWTSNYELGLGMDIYFEYFKFSPSIRGVFGIEDAMMRDENPNSPWTGNIGSMKSRGIFVNFTFH